MIPPHVVRVIRLAREVFDYVVIATPYHDVAGADWEDLAWLRSIDPYVLGFHKKLNCFCVLGRFSDTGVFPLHTELVADTVEFLRANIGKLKGFDKVSQPFWYRGAVLGLSTQLTQNTNALLFAFQAGRLFDWLRGEWTAPEIPAKS